jgi:hypothetical protein
MKTLLITLAALTLLSCSPIKRHQRLVRKHPHLLELISTPKQDTIIIDNTKQVECPDGTVIQVDCDTIVIIETNTITLPPTNAQIRQQERTKRNFEDNVRKMYEDSLKFVGKAFEGHLKHKEKMYKLENQRLKDELREERKINRQNQITQRTQSRQWSWIVIAFLLGILSNYIWRLFLK